MIIFDRQGNFLRSWGEGQYPRARGVHVAPDGTMFLTDDGGHFVRKVTLDGKILLELGVPGKPAPFMSGEPFHRCTLPQAAAAHAFQEGPVWHSPRAARGSPSEPL